MAQVNENILYQPDEQPSHPASLAHGFQNVMTRMAAMAATASIHGEKERKKKIK
jgi:hypothetical protein